MILCIYHLWNKYVNELHIYSIDVMNNIVDRYISMNGLSQQIILSLLQLHLDQWNVRHVTLIGYDDHAFVFFSFFQTLYNP